MKHPNILIDTEVMIDHALSIQPPINGSSVVLMRKHKTSKCPIVSLGSLFPEEFYTFLRVFMVRFASLPALTPDEKIAR